MNTLLYIYVSGVLINGIAASAETEAKYSFTTYIHEPNKTENCSRRQQQIKVGFGDQLCRRLRNMKSADPNGSCTEYIYKNTGFDIEVMKVATLHIALQYCNGTQYFDNCFQCFNVATQPLRYMHPCAHYGKWKGIPGCLERFPNPDFSWSRAVILNGTRAVKRLVEGHPPIDKCNKGMQEMFSSGGINVSFPINLTYYGEDENKEATVVLSLLINAFENILINVTEQSELPQEAEDYYDGNYSTEEDSNEVTCEDLVNSPYMNNYIDKMNPHPLNPVPLKIIDSYKTLRADMCNNVTECVTCFNESDNLVLFYTRNWVANIPKVIRDYYRGIEILRYCIQKHTINPEYVAIINEYHYGMDKVNVSLCHGSVQEQLDFMTENPTYFNTSSIAWGAKYIIDVVTFNAYSFFGYALRNNGTEACSVIEDSEIICNVKYTADLIDWLRTAVTEADEDDDIREYNFYTRKCYKYEREWDNSRITDLTDVLKFEN